MKEESSFIYNGFLSGSLRLVGPRPQVLHIWPILPIFLSSDWQIPSVGVCLGLVKPLILQMRVIPQVTQSTFVKQMKILELFKNG